MSPFVTETAKALEASGIDLSALGLAWARCLPVVTLVPAFGMRALPAPARAVLGIALAASFSPALSAATMSTHGLPWVAAALVEVVRGLPIAISAAVPLWAATSAGGLIDGLRGAQVDVSSPVVEGRTGVVGVLFSILASLLFLIGGGAAHVAQSLVSAPPSFGPVLLVVHALTEGIGLAVALAAPLIGASIVLEVAFGLIAKAASPSQIHALVAPLRAIALLGILGLSLERIEAFLALQMPH